MTAAVTAPAERLFRAHLELGQFLAGVADGRWRVLAINWPVVTVWVAAAQRDNSPVGFVLRLDVSGYPDQAPTGSLWDDDADRPLRADQRPRGPRVGTVFRTDWEAGKAMYAAWDRVALASHPWTATHPLTVWTSDRTIVHVLAAVHELLNAHDYLGA